MNIVLFKPEKLSPPKKGYYYLNGVKLTPHRNNLSKAQFTKLQGSPLYEEFLELGAIEVITPKVIQNLTQQKVESEQKDTFGESKLATFSIKDAEKLIAITDSVTELDKWETEEVLGKKRKGVLAAISKRKEQLTLDE